MVNKKVIVYLDDMSIDKSLEIVYNIIKDDESEPMVIKTAAEIVGIRLGDKAPHSRLVGSSKHDKKNNGGKKMKRIISLALILILTLICGVQIAADSAETYAMCTHPHVTYVIAGKVEYVGYDSAQPCRKYRMVYDIEQCDVCGKTVRVITPGTRETYVEHEPVSAGGGVTYCRYCGKEI